MKRKIFLLTVLAMALPLAALADEVSFTSTGGTFTGTSFGYVLTNAALTQYTAVDGTTYSGSNLGTVSFSTSPITGGNVITGSSFLAGGSMTITGNGTNGIPNGTLFTGTFEPGGTWGYQVQSDGSYLYTLNAQVTGQTGSGNSATGTTTFSIDLKGIFPGYTYGGASGTDTVSLAVPEPGELSLLGMGLVGLVGAIRRKITC